MVVPSFVRSYLRTFVRSFVRSKQGILLRLCIHMYVRTIRMYSEFH